jgi:hypothetical protein
MTVMPRHAEGAQSKASNIFAPYRSKIAGGDKNALVYSPDFGARRAPRDSARLQLVAAPSTPSVDPHRNGRRR